MKVKYIQKYSNECGLYAIKNLLFLYGIKKEKIDLKYDEKGTTIYQMVKTLKKYFYNVDAISFDIKQLKKVKKFTPFITLIEKDNIGHYVVIFKKDKKYLYILDSLARKSYKLTYEKFERVYSSQSIVMSNVKEIKLNIKSNKKIILIPILTLIESLFLLSTTILLQQIIDYGLKDALLYLFIQLTLLLITTYKIKIFLKTFKTLDEDVTSKTLKSIYNLNLNYVKKYQIDEIYYRINDAYEYKNMILTFVFNLLSDVLLAICTITLMFIYSYIVALIVISLCIIIVFISLKIFNKNKEIVENRRVAEYEFFNSCRESIKNKDEIYLNKNRIFENESLKLLKKLQKQDYQYEKLLLSKNLILTYFQTIVISFLVVLYFTNFYNYLSIGSLVALINLVSLMLQPILNICSEISKFSNISLIKQRLKDLNENNL